MTLMLFACCEDLWQHPSYDYLQKKKWGHRDLVAITQVLRMYVMNVFHWIFCSYAKHIGIGHKSVFLIICDMTKLKSMCCLKCYPYFWCALKLITFS